MTSDCHDLMHDISRNQTSGCARNEARQFLFYLHINVINRSLDAHEALIQSSNSALDGRIEELHNLVNVPNYKKIWPRCWAA